MTENQNNRVLMTSEDYTKLCGRIEELEAKLKRIRARKGDIYKESASDNLRTPGVRGIETEELIALTQLRELQDISLRVEIVERTQASHVEMGDIVKVEDSINGEEAFPLVFRLVSYVASRETDGIDNVSINSEMGKAIYQKSVGEVGTFINEIGRHDITVLSKLSLEEALQELAAIEEEESFVR